MQSSLVPLRRPATASTSRFPHDQHYIIETSTSKTRSERHQPAKPDQRDIDQHPQIRETTTSTTKSETHPYFQDPDQMNQSLMKLLQIMKMIYQVRKISRPRTTIGPGVELLQHVGEGGLPPGEDHQPGDPQLQEVHHREWKPHHLESGWNLNKSWGEKVLFSAGERSDREQAEPVHPVEHGLQRGLPEDQEQKGAVVRVYNLHEGLTFSQGCAEGQGVQFQREIHLWPL